MGSSLSILASYRCICTRQGKENQCWNSYCRGWRSLLGQNWMKSLENKFLFFQSRLFQVKIEDEQTRFLTLVRHPEMHDVMKYVVTPFPPNPMQIYPKTYICDYQLAARGANLVRRNIRFSPRLDSKKTYISIGI